MMVALLLCAYSRGVYSSRRIARACEERLDFQAVTALNQRDYRIISEFRRRHLDTLAGLLVQVLALCRRAGLASLNHVAVDGVALYEITGRGLCVVSYACLDGNVRLTARYSEQTGAWLHETGSSSKSVELHLHPARQRSW